MINKMLFGKYLVQAWAWTWEVKTSVTITDSNGKRWHLLGISQEWGMVLMVLLTLSGGVLPSTAWGRYCRYRDRRGNQVSGQGRLAQGHRAGGSGPELCLPTPLFFPPPPSLSSLLSWVSLSPGCGDGVGSGVRVLNVLTVGLMPSLPPTLPFLSIHGANVSGHPVSSWPVRRSRLLQLWRKSLRPWWRTRASCSRSAWTTCAPSGTAGGEGPLGRGAFGGPRGRQAQALLLAFLLRRCPPDQAISLFSGPGLVTWVHILGCPSPVATGNVTHFLQKEV